MEESSEESEVDIDAAGRGGDARAHHLAVGLLHVAGAQVAHRAGARARPTQVLQMPIRQPCGSSAPACSPATSSGVVPSASISRSLARKRTRPPSAHAGGGDDRPEALEVQPLGEPARSKRSVSASSRPAGPHAHVSRSRQSGTRRSRSAHVPKRPSRSPWCSCSRKPRWVRASRRSSASEDRVLARRGDVDVHNVAEARRRVPEPAQHAHHGRDRRCRR